MTEPRFADLAPAERRERLRSVTSLFLKLGCLSFGGPAAHIALMEEEVVRRRGWLDRPAFLDLLAAANLIPGPSSTELAIYIGYRRAGWRGLALAGACFILPAALITGILAALYLRFQALPQAAWLMYGIKPAIIAVVAQALFSLTRSAVKGWATGAVGAGAALAAWFGYNPLLLLLLSGMIVMLASRRSAPGPAAWLLPAPALLAPTAALPPGATAAAPTLAGLLLAFLKVGSVVYGSGYVLLAFLQGDFVERWHWLTNQQLLDAVAIGQFTPGPVFTTATFIGYLLGGTAGAGVATLGIFLPAFIFVPLVNIWLPKLRRSKQAGAFLDGVSAASLGLMAAVSVRLAVAALLDPLTIAIAVVSLVLLLRLRFSSFWLVIGGAVLGLAVHLAWQ